MDFLDHFRDPKTTRELLGTISEMSDGRPINLMEVCGTHTVSIARYGFRSIMPAGVSLLSGPGCPVCVTDNHDIDTAIAFSRIDGVIVCTFGDMMRVPGSSTTLSSERSCGRDVRVCYSPLDAIKVAQDNPDKQVVFIGVGFETTAPVVGAALLQASEMGLNNFTIYGMHKTMPNAMEAIANDPETAIDGFILPGHVSTITGMAPYQFLADTYGIPGVICGFEPVDILETIALLMREIKDGTASIKNAYPRGVNDEGNIPAQELIAEIYEPSDAGWRGLGVIPGSGLAIKDKYAEFDALKRFEDLLDVEETHDHKGCRCGDVLRGAMGPDECPLFGKVCTPENPVGPCMVSSEGSCAAYYRYHEKSRKAHK